MADLLIDFLERPTEESFVRLRAAVLSEPVYDFGAQDDADLAKLMEDGEFAAAAAMRSQLMPNWLLSPRVHQMLASAAESIGDKETAQSERYFARASLRGLLLSGDGAPERPYLVTHVADEYDLLATLDKAALTQRIVNTGSGSFDVITCRDGSEVWFDVTSGLTSAVG